MDRLAQEIEAASAQIDARWDDARAARVFAGVGQLRRRRQVARALLTSSLVTVSVVALFVFSDVEGSAVDRLETTAARTQSGRADDPRPLIGSVRADHKLRLADGSTTRLAGASSQLDILENDSDNVALRLRAGLATFEVVPNKARRFVVSAGEIDVIVVGTAFEVERRDSAVRVSVRHGKVRVVGPDGVRYLEAGQARQFVGGHSEEIVQESPAHGTEGAVPAPGLPTTRKRARGRGPERVTKGSGESSVGQPNWRSLMQSGDYEGAYAALSAGANVGDDPGALLDAADAARLSGSPARAVGYLEQVVDGYPGSPVAPLAAFTMGRVLLDRLGQPHRAASVFARARALAPGGSLAQDALAREVEALSKGGDAARAHQRAREYMRLYPSGRRLRSVQLYGGFPGNQR